MKKAKWWAASAGIGFLLLLVAGATQERRGGKAPASGKRESFETGLSLAQEMRALAGAYGERLDRNEAGLRSVQDDLEKTRTAVERMAEVFSAEPPPPPAAEATADPETARFRTFEFDPPPAEPRLRLPAGSFGEATLLTGVYAPTTGEPLPVLLRLESVLVGPHRTRLPLPHALLVGKASGDANARRATIQLETLSWSAGSGRTIEIPTNGWVIDQDGVQGLSGQYIWRAEEIAAFAAAAGALSAGAEAMAARESTSLLTPLGGVTAAVTGDPLRLAQFRAAGGAADKLSEAVAERLKEVVPAIHVTNGRRVTVAFISGSNLDGLTAGEVLHDANRDPYRGLDAHR